MTTQSTCATVIISSTLALLDQFSKSLSPSSTPPTEAEGSPSPLPLLSAAASALKAQVAKLSLLTITAPFTPSAICSSLSPLNESILPSLATAALIISPITFTASFTVEATHLCRTTLKDLTALVVLVQERDKNHNSQPNLSETGKTAVTEATGKVWQDCDNLVEFASGSLTGHVVKKANQWLELMKDAVKELQEYDPEEDEEDDGLLSDGLEEVENLKDDNSASEASGTIKAGVKIEALKVITRLPQSMHVVIRQRLFHLPPAVDLCPTQRTTVEAVLHQSQQISECIDECAENMYMGDLEGCLKKAGQARQITIEVVESVLEPWTRHDIASGGGQGLETREDLYIKRALAWIQQIQLPPSSLKDRTTS